MNERDEASQRNLNESTFYIITHDDGGGASAADKHYKFYVYIFSLSRILFLFRQYAHACIRTFVSFYKQNLAAMAISNHCDTNENRYIFIQTKCIECVHGVLRMLCMKRMPLTVPLYEFMWCWCWLWLWFNTNLAQKF